jgi:hypothetical protein
MKETLLLWGSTFKIPVRSADDPVQLAIENEIKKNIEKTPVSIISLDTNQQLKQQQQRQLSSGNAGESSILHPENVDKFISDVTVKISEKLQRTKNSDVGGGGGDGGGLQKSSSGKSFTAHGRGSFKAVTNGNSSTSSKGSKASSSKLLARMDSIKSLPPRPRGSSPIPSPTSMGGRGTSRSCSPVSLGGGGGGGGGDGTILTPLASKRPPKAADPSDGFFNPIKHPADIQREQEMAQLKQQLQKNVVYTDATLPIPHTSTSTSNSNSTSTSSGGPGGGGEGPPQPQRDLAWFGGKHHDCDTVLYRAPLQGWNTLSAASSSSSSSTARLVAPVAAAAATTAATTTAATAAPAGTTTTATTAAATAAPAASLSSPPLSY